MKTRQQGFSLIELLVVIAIIGILAAVGTISYRNYANTAKEEVAKVNFYNISDYVEQVELLITSGLDSTGGLSGDVSTTKAIADAIEIEMSDDINNPYQSDEAAVISGDSLIECEGNAGKIMLFGTEDNNELEISTCYSEEATPVFAIITVK